jgi:hypothetical protein
MSAMTNLLVKDDANPKVEATLVPITDTPNPLWRGKLASVPLAGQLRAECYEEILKDGKRRRVLKLVKPVMETLGVSGTSAGYVAPPRVAYEDSGFISLIVDQRSTVADAANLLSLLIGLAQGASSTTATGVLNQASAADAFKNSILPLVAFLTNGEIPS